MANYAIANDIFVNSVDYPLYRFTNRDIVLNSLSAVFTVDTIGNELSVDTFAFTVRHDPRSRPVYAPVGADAYRTQPGPLYALASQPGRDYMAELPFGTPIWWYVGGELMKKGYIKSVNRVSKFAWRIECISGVGLLDNAYHVGGIYNGAVFGDMVEEIVGGIFPVTISPQIHDAPVFGWLPYDTRRKNLHRLLFALGAAMLRGDATTDYVISLLDAPAAPQEIPDSRISIGGSVQYNLPATGVEVTEHAFLAADDSEQLFDASGEIVSGQLVVFDAPHHDLTTTGTLTILESGVNFARISGSGILSGKTYTHNRNVLALNTGAASTPLIKRVEDNCLISAINSFSVATRVLSYFSSAKTVGGKIVLADERCGSAYAFTDGFGEQTVGIVQQMQIGVTSIKAASVTIVEGYDPKGQGNSYTEATILTGSGNYTIPSENCRIVLIQGGHGGFPGTDGDAGAGELSTGTGAGGLAGLAGEGGKIYARDLTGLTVGSVVAYSCGSGGNPGEDGGETTFGDYSSADGERLKDGVLNLFDGVRYGTPGLPGVDGGAAVTGAIAYKGRVYVKGETAAVVTGGAPGLLLGGGKGGGPAAGADGQDGHLGGYQVSPAYYVGGRGGDGANAVPGDDATVYGSGGNGGNGGGGGGDGGWPNWSSPYTHRGKAGFAGLGSLGGAGAAGCIIIYH